MNSRAISRIGLILLVILTNVSCDQLSKNYVREHVQYHDHVTLVEHFLTLTKVENTGAFLSLGNSMPEGLRVVVLTLLPMLVLLLAMMFILKSAKGLDLRTIGMSFIIGGGFGNVYDRLIHGSVTDFLHMDFGFFQTGIFNMADVSIMVGTILVLGDMLLGSLLTKGAN